ncbi:hypothetical protein ACFWN1_20925 [Streptomyces sp. NPDC058459]|uniref:hypothetical protein n=1 Tax=Streptomyces sp. NPDC058459 TaxID=3346508 RepID=UPI0036485019
MTSSPVRGRPRHATAHIRVRVAHALVGVVAGAGWLAIPVLAAQEPATASPPAHATPAASGAASAPRDDESSAVDLILPVAVLGTAGVLAAYGWVRRSRRSPGVTSAAPAVAAPAETDRQARAALVRADDRVRTCEEELPFAAALIDERTLTPFRRAIHTARTELSAAFSLWQRYEEGEPHDPVDRRQILAGVVGRCAEAERVLDARAADLDRPLGPALDIAERAFRGLAARASDGRATAAGLRARYGPSAGARAAGCVEEAMDRLVFATSRINDARRAADSGEDERGTWQLRSAEGAVAQAGILLAGLDRTARRLREAAALVPAALTGAEAVLAAAAPAPPGADGTLAAVREELTAGPYDPLAALRRITRALVRLPGARTGVLDTAADLVARAATGEAEDFVAVHRGAVAADARSLLAAAVRTLAAPHPVEAAALARRALESAERDVRTRGVPASEAEDSAGALRRGEPDHDPPVSDGGPETHDHSRPRPD